MTETKTDNRIAALSIIVEDPEKTEELNQVIHEYASFVIGRMGIPYREKKINIISLVLDAPQNVISSLSGKIGRIRGVTAKAAYAKYQSGD
jgi:putative iron-only hydrogenase system regulator